jgi:hypothetical protein
MEQQEPDVSVTPPENCDLWFLKTVTISVMNSGGFKLNG